MKRVGWQWTVPQEEIACTFYSSSPIQSRLLWYGDEIHSLTDAISTCKTGSVLSDHDEDSRRGRSFDLITSNPLGVSTENIHNLLPTRETAI